VDKENANSNVANIQRGRTPGKKKRSKKITGTLADAPANISHSTVGELNFVLELECDEIFCPNEPCIESVRDFHPAVFSPENIVLPVKVNKVVFVDKISFKEYHEHEVLDDEMKTQDIVSKIDTNTQDIVSNNEALVPPVSAWEWSFLASSLLVCITLSRN